MTLPRDHRRTALFLGLAVFLLYNANGREIDVGDSVPTRLLAREMVLRHTTTLDHAVSEQPEYETWPSFVTVPDGHVRSAYPVAPAALAAVVAASLSWTGAVDLDAALAMPLVAKLTASLLTTISVVFAFLIARRRAGDGQALAVALAFGLGTGLWPTVSQTLWRHETAIVGVMGAIFFFDRDADRPARPELVGLCLALAGMSRPQVAPAIAIIALGVIMRSPAWRAVLRLWPLAALGCLAIGLNLWWFGQPLGPTQELLAAQRADHAVSGEFNWQPWAGAAGLLVSPNRGLLVFSPVVLVALAGLGALGGDRPAARTLRWCCAAFVAQFALYCCFAIWWAGYTYGPRYALDALPMLVPLAAEGTRRLWSRRVLRATAAALLAWSVGVSAVGAFCYSAVPWNSEPEDVDLRHERLWDWKDLEIVYYLEAGPQADNFQLFSRASVRR